MKFKKAIPGLVAIIFVISTGVVLAADNSDITQQITAGTLATDFLDNSRVPVASPVAAFGSKAFSFNCQSGGGAATATLGTNTERLYVTNPGGANAGWNLTIAATGGVSDVWENGGATSTYDYNDPTTSGCGDGADGDTKSGQLTVNPSVATVNLDCLTCTSTGVTLGTSSAYSQGVIDDITLVTAAAGSDDIWRGYLTGIGLSQTIPAEQSPDNYSLNLTVTATAN